MTPRSCVWSKRASEQVVTDGTTRPRRRRGPRSVAPAQAWPRAVQPLVPAHRRGHPRQPRRPDPRAALPEGRRPGRGVRVSRLLHQRHARVPGGPHGHRAGGSRRRARDLHAQHQQHDHHPVDRDDPHPGGRHRHDPRPASRSRTGCRTCSRRSTRRSATSGWGSPGPPAARTCRCSPRSSCSSCSRTGSASSRASAASSGSGPRRATSTSPWASPCCRS